MRILIADDDRTIQALLRGVLPNWGYEPVSARTGDQAWEILRSEDAPRIAILDWVMPGVDGIGLCRMVRARICPDYTYLILLTSRASRQDAVEALEAGADDFVAKPFHLHELRARLRPGRRILELERELARRANYDGLTGLPNRTLLSERFAQLSEIAKRRGETIALLYLDLDDFKTINDTYGHQQGDYFLKEIATRIRSTIRDSDTLARVGGDEFVLLAGGAERELIPAFVYKLHQALGRPLSLEGGVVLPRASIGVSFYPEDGTDLEVLQEHADVAMYRHKRRGKVVDPGEVSSLVAIGR
jgi:two-component system cell cycle response regulator